MRTDSFETHRGDLAYAVAYSGAIGSAIIASLFLILDTMAGRPLETPILMGSALFFGELASASGPLRLDLAAGYSLVHLVMFTSVGGVFAFLAQRLRGVPSLARILAGGLFLALTAGFFALDAIVGPNLAAAIGMIPIVLGNLLAAGGMTAFYAQAFELEGFRVSVPTTLIGDSG